MAVNINDIRNKNKVRILNDLSLKIAQLKKSKIISRAWVFGSFAKGNWTAFSDIDLIVTTFEEMDNLSIESEREIDLIFLTESEFTARYEKNKTFRDLVDTGILL